MRLITTRGCALPAKVAGFLLAGWASMCVAGAEPPKEPLPSLMSKAKQAIADGRFIDARRLLDPHLPINPAPVTTGPLRLIEIMRRIRLDYALTAEQMLAKLRESMPDVTAGDVARWSRAGELQHRVIDGTTFYFKREPSNLLRFSNGARVRWARHHDGKLPAFSTWTFPLVEHVAELVKRAARSDDPLIYPVKHRIRYALRVPQGHRRVKTGAQVRCWLPYPQMYRQQSDIALRSSSPEHKQIAPDGTSQRTIYFEQTVTKDGMPLEFVAEFEFTTRAYCPRLEPGQAVATDPDDLAIRPYLAARPPHIPIDDEIQALAGRIVGDEHNPLLRARRLFRWVCDNIRYCAETEYSTIDSLTQKALRTRKGDCGVQALTFITLCRAAGVPARWQSGWATPPDDWNMHDWAEFYVAPWGWLPADPSYGVLEHADREVQEFYCGHLDAYRMIVNLDYGRALKPPKTSFRSEPNDFQRGEIEIDGYNLYFDEWEWDFTVETTPPDSATP